MNGLLVGIGVAVAGIVAGTIALANSKYDENGYDKDGYDRNGYDRNGYDKNGYNRNGYNIDGYDKSGYNIFGYNRNGYDRNGYDKDGYDRSYNSRDFYLKEYNEINNLLDRAKKQMKNSEFSYALHDIRIGLEKGVKCVISHLCAEEFQKNTLDDNITYCKYNNLLERDFIERLYSAKNHCNSLQHDNDCTKSYNQVHFAYKVLEELSNIVLEYSIDNSK